MKKETQYIYYLTDPITNEVKYVGKTKTPKSRYEQHLRKLDKTNTPKRQWLVELFKKGLKPKNNVSLTEQEKKDRKREWESLSEPKPSWETFKRLLSSANNDAQKALKMWKKKNSRKGTVI